MVTSISKFQEKSSNGNIRGDPHDRELGKDDSLSPSTPPKSTKTQGGEENYKQITPFDPIQVSDFAREFWS